MYKLISAILLVAFLGQTFNQGFYYLSYLIDNAAYAKKCVNKSKPKMNCNGKCQLMKQIEEQEKKQQQEAPEMKLANKIEVLSFKNFYLSFCPIVFEGKKTLHRLTNIGSPIDQPSSFFHPPGLSINSLQGFI